MATYNGAPFLEEQLKSLSQQDLLPFELVVCDDGSNDASLVILEKFAKDAPFPVRIHRNEKNLGFSNNFLKAAKLCEGEWVAFCDQDDVWLPNKLSAVSSVLNTNSNANIVLQNAIISNSDLSETGRIFPNKIRSGVYGASSQYGFWVWLGFLQTFRRELLANIPTEDRPMNYFPGHRDQSHDKWTCMIANALGGIVVLTEPAAIYRRHSFALTGEYRAQTSGEKVSKALNVTSDNYHFLAGVAGSSSLYLRRAAEACGKAEWKTALSVAADNFDRLAGIQRTRAALYLGENIASRLKAFSKIVSFGGYWGAPMFAMGTMSAAKDFFAVVGVISLDKRRSRQ